MLRCRRHECGNCACRRGKSSYTALLQTQLQELEEVFPELVLTEASGKEGEEGFKSVSYARLSVVLLEGLKEMMDQEQRREDEVAALKREVLEIRGIVEEMREKAAEGRGAST